MSENNMNEMFTEQFVDPAVVTVPIDDTLQNSGEAADAAAVGAALALKADAASITAIKVNGESADNQGNIIIDGTDIKMGGGSQTSLSDAITSAAGRTGADIPVSGEPGAMTIQAAISQVDAANATTIPMAEGSTTTVAQKISAMDATAAAHGASIVALQGKTAGDIPVETGSTETVKDALGARVKTVNGEGPDSAGDVTLRTVPEAENLVSSLSQTSTDEFILRTSGGEASIETGGAWLMDIRGAGVKTGYTARSVNLTVTETGTEGHMEATADDDAVEELVAEGGTYTFVYSTEWTLGGESADPADYGITVTGTPVAGDTMVLVYVKEVPGTILVANPTKFVSTGWNLYDNANGYARVVKYSATQTYRVSGAASALKFSSTYSGTKSDITVTSGAFDPFSASDPIGTTGYVWVTGGDATTAIWTARSDWGSGYDGTLEAFTSTEIDLSDIMDEYFPNGLLRAGDTADEINLNIGVCYVRVERLANNAANMATAKGSGREFDYDEDYIYLALAAEVSHNVSIDGTYTADDHGLEWFDDTEGPVEATTLYGNNLKNKLERDVLTISQQTLTADQKTQVQQNIGLAVTTGTITCPLTSGTSDRMRLEKSGHVISASARRHTITDNTVRANATIFNIPAGFRPAADVSVMGYYMTGGTFVACFFTVGSDGTVKCGGSSSAYGTQFFFAGSWMI